jgi:hypothetical protein
MDASIFPPSATAGPARPGSPFLTTVQAADYVGLSPRTLEKMRVLGGGPRYRKHGRYVRYHIDDLNAWSSSRTHDSTSDGAATAPPTRRPGRRRRPPSRDASPRSPKGNGNGNGHKPS